MNFSGLLDDKTIFNIVEERPEIDTVGIPDDFRDTRAFVDLQQSKAFAARGVVKALMTDTSPVVAIFGAAGTGKTRGILEKIHLLCTKYPGTRVLIARKTRASLTEAAMYTLETFVLPDGHPSLAQGGLRDKRQKYSYPNGSEIVVCGLDKPEKALSTEYDMIYVQEATEITEHDYETLDSRLRSQALRYTQFLMDLNPDVQTHWIYKAGLAGRIKLVQSYHEDNPLWFDEAPKDAATGKGTDFPVRGRNGRYGRWTDAGRQYIFGRLANLTGPRRKRFFLGMWGQSEGTIYADQWRPHLHIVPRFTPREPGWKWVWVTDFGWRNALVIGIWCISPESWNGEGKVGQKAYLWGEVFMSKSLVRVCAKMALKACGWEWDGYQHIRVSDNPIPLPVHTICDWDPEGRATFEENTGLSTQPAHKVVKEGIEAVQAALIPNPVETKELQEEFLNAEDIVEAMQAMTDDDEHINPDIYFMQDSLLHPPDSERKSAHRPCKTIEEFNGYRWSDTAREVPAAKQDDDGMDMVRMFVTWWKNVKKGDSKPNANNYANLALVKNSHTTTKPVRDAVTAKQWSDLINDEMLDSRVKRSDELLSAYHTRRLKLDKEETIF